ncbi:MAG: hypothetical protein IJ193_09345 [Bacilli bacterium]|nr:hypothetical protein [Bacilli bacterium]
MDIEIYKGKYVTAEDANNYIDSYTITSGCSMLNDGASKLSDMVTKLQVLKEDCSSSNLSVQGSSMEPIIEAYIKSTMDFAKSISELADTLHNTTRRVLNRKQVLLNEEARAKDEQQMSSSEEII